MSSIRYFSNFSLLSTVLLMPLTMTGCGEEDTAVTFSNLPPFSPIVDVQPATPYTDDDLEALIVSESIDPDDDVVTLNYVWYKNDVIQEDITGSVVSADKTSAGEIWTVAVYSSDGSLNSADTRRSVTIRNSLPAWADVKLEWVAEDGSTMEFPSETTDIVLADYTGYSIQVVANSTDADGDDITYSYDWTLNNGDANIDGNMVEASILEHGQNWSVTVSATDGTGSSETVPLTFDFYNAAPMIQSVSILSDNAIIGDTLECEAMATDEENDELTFTYTWNIVQQIIPENETEAQEVTTEETGMSLDTTDFALDAQITCTAIAHDGIDNSESMSTATFTITDADHSMPVISSVTINPSAPILGVDSDIVCSATASDPQNNALSFEYNWTLDGGDGSSLSTTDTLSIATLQVGDSVTCSVVASDGRLDSASMEASVGIMNSKPTITDVSISPSTPSLAIDTTITCSATAVDDQGDALTFTYVWTDATNNTISNTATLDITTLSEGDQVTCTAVVSDGTMDSDPSSTTATIGL